MIKAKGTRAICSLGISMKVAMVELLDKAKKAMNKAVEFIERFFGG